MRGWHASSFCVLGVVLPAVCALVLGAQSGKPHVSLVSHAEDQVVLYAVHRGDYESFGAVIGRLYALAALKGMTSSGPVSFVYLNDPSRVSSEHWLTEIRIPVSPNALRHAGTMGGMIDVKTVKPTVAAVVTKPEGTADPEPAYEALFAWMVEQGYVPTDRPCETFLTNATTGNYAQMRTQISIPVRRVRQEQGSRALAPGSPEQETRMSTAPIPREVIREDGLVAEFFFRRDAAPQLPVIFLGGSGGGLPARGERNITSDLVLSGYCVLSVAFFGEPGLPAALQGVPLEFYNKAKTWLAKHPKVAHNGIAIVGSSKGAELALLLASRDPEVKCVVAIAPSSHVFEGIPGGNYEPRSSWSYEGRDLPYVPYQRNATLWRAITTYEFHDVYREALEKAEPETRDRARTPVENIQGAVLLISGRRDRMWPATQMSEDIVKTLEEKQFRFPYEHAVFDIGHSIGNEQWQKAVKFLSKHYHLGEMQAEQQ